MGILYQPGTGDPFEDDGNDRLVLPTGRAIYSDGGVIGLQAFPDEWDGPDVYVVARADESDAVDASEWTPEERRELAEFMVMRWQVFGGMLHVENLLPTEG